MTPSHRLHIMKRLEREAVRELQKLEDRRVFEVLEQVARDLRDEKDLERLKKRPLLPWLPAILVVSSPIALTLIWAMSQ